MSSFGASTAFLPLICILEAVAIAKAFCKYDLKALSGQYINTYLQTQNILYYASNSDTQQEIRVFLAV